jgi:predicted ester cyclase
MATEDRNTVEKFYSQVLSVGGAPDVVTEAEKYLAPEWKSVGNYSGQNKDRTAFAKQVAGFLQLMPDLKWHVEEIVNSGDRFIVRSRASGTPKGPLFGVGPSGKKFEIMTIDMHTMKGGKIAETFHVEDWAGALAQLK